MRYFNVYGPGQSAEGTYGLVIPRFPKLRDRGKLLTIYGDGRQTLSYTHVSDVVRANLLAGSADLPVGENIVLNIGPDEETSVNEIAEMIGGQVEYIYPNLRGKFEELRKSADYASAKVLIGWEPRISPSEDITAVAVVRNKRPLDLVAVELGTESQPAS